FALASQSLRRHTLVSYQSLTHVNTRWYTERIQYDINRHSVGIVWHVFYRQDVRYYTLVTVTTRHLITWLDTTFDRQINLNDFQNTRCEFIACRQFAFLLSEFLIDL